MQFYNNFSRQDDIDRCLYMFRSTSEILRFLSYTHFRFSCTVPFSVFNVDKNKWIYNTLIK